MGTAAHPEQALAFPRWAEVDVASLDIVTPGMPGIELARRLPDDPLVVFVTGYNDYAVEAFRLNAVDQRDLAQALDQTAVPCVQKPVT